MYCLVFLKVNLVWNLTSFAQLGPISLRLPAKGRLPWSWAHYVFSWRRLPTHDLTRFQCSKRGTDHTPTCLSLSVVNLSCLRVTCTTFSFARVICVEGLLSPPCLWYDRHNVWVNGIMYKRSSDCLADSPINAFADYSDILCFILWLAPF